MTVLERPSQLNRNRLAPYPSAAMRTKKQNYLRSVHALQVAAFELLSTLQPEVKIQAPAGPRRTRRPA